MVLLEYTADHREENKQSRKAAGDLFLHERGSAEIHQSMAISVTIDTSENDVFDEIMEWLEENASGQYALHMINWIVRIDFEDLSKAVHFKMRWYNVID